jgi:hypothetical protein
VLAVTDVLFMIFLQTRRSEMDPDHAAADTAGAGAAHTAAATFTIVLAVAFLPGLGDGDPRGSLTRYCEPSWDGGEVQRLPNEVAERDDKLCGLDIAAGNELARGVRGETHLLFGTEQNDVRK